MKKNNFLYLLAFFLLFLVSCSQQVPAELYKLHEFKEVEQIEDYTYKIFTDYQEYQVNKNDYDLKEYTENDFENNTIIILYLLEATSGNIYKLGSTTKKGSELFIRLELDESGLQPAFTTDAYCIKVETKKIETVSIKRIV